MGVVSEASPGDDPIVGIDLGTTNSLVAFADGRSTRVLCGRAESPLVPSTLAFQPDGSVVIGEAALAPGAAPPGGLVTSVKRLMGRSKRDAARDLPFLAYEVVEGEHSTARVRLPWGREVAPEEASAKILLALRERAERVLGCPVRRAVVTVPAYFDDPQRQATRTAGRLAGLDVVRIINEPTAAALAYGLGSVVLTSPRTIAVYDLGGGTFDVSILRVIPASIGEATDEPAIFQVLSTAGDTRLGGDDLDRALATVIVDAAGAAREGQAAAAFVESLSPQDRRALLDEARRVKHVLSEQADARAGVDLSDRRLECVVTRERFERAASGLVDRTLECCRRALADASRSPAWNAGARAKDRASIGLDAVILVGGATRTPLVRQAVRGSFGIEPYSAIDPDQAVALGAAEQARLLSQRDRRAGAKGGGTPAPALLLDVVPLSLGVETMGGGVAKLILRNATIPARARESFSTSTDGQTSIRLHVLQGEREMAEDCRSLGVFHLRGIPPMPAGIPKVEVEFSVDANGVLVVGAVEARSGRRAELQVVPSHGLTREEVDRLERESFTHAREDMDRHRVADLVVAAGLDAKWIGERLERFGDRLEPELRRALTERLAGVRAMIDAAKADWRSVDPSAMQRAKEELDRSSVRLQEISIAESLRAEGLRGLPEGR